LLNVTHKTNTNPNSTYPTNPTLKPGPNPNPKPSPMAPCVD